MTESGVETVERFQADSGERIYRIACDFHRPLCSYAYLILGDCPPTMIDCGTGEENCLDEILAGFEQVRTVFHERFEVADIERIIITHAHIDHGGGAAFFQEKSDALVLCHQFDSAVMCRYDERSAVGSRRFHDFLVWAGVEPARRKELVRAFGFTPRRAKSLEKVTWLENGQILDNLTIHHTPGHSPGHICIQIGGSHLILGDHVLSRTLTPVWPERVSPDSGLIRFYDSIDKIRRLVSEKPMIGLPGHEQVVTSIPTRLDMIENSHRRRLERILKLLEESDQPKSIDQLARKMYLASSGNAAFLALIDIGARMEYLELHNRVRIVNADELEQDRTDVYLYADVK